MKLMSLLTGAPLSTFHAYLLMADGQPRFKVEGAGQDGLRYIAADATNIVYHYCTSNKPLYTATGNSSTNEPKPPR